MDVIEEGVYLQKARLENTKEKARGKVLIQSHEAKAQLHLIRRYQTGAGLT